jgi:signal peptidase I
MKGDKNLEKNDLKEKDLKTKKSGLRENIEAIILAVILALFIRTFVVQAFKIPSGSMKDTLLVGDHILVNKFIYGIKIPFIQKTLIAIKDPQPEDIVVFIYPVDPRKDFIKRVIGIAGDVIEIKDKQVFINGEVFEHKAYEKYEDPGKLPAKSSQRDNYGPVTVPPNSLFVMGDNRDKSLDSRFWGFVPLKNVKGKAFIIYWSSVLPRGWIWSWNWNTLVLRWDRLGKTLK